MLIEVEQLRWGGTDLDPPRKLGRHQVHATRDETTLRISTDEKTLGHPCAEVFHFIIAGDAFAKAEFEITETQTSRTSRIISGHDWTAVYPDLTGPSGLRITYRPLHGYLD